jgi:hypothetical protein
VRCDRAKRVELQASITNEIGIRRAHTGHEEEETLLRVSHHPQTPIFLSIKSLKFEVKEKCFAFTPSQHFDESSLFLQEQGVVESGLHLGLHAFIGPGGVAEVLGCFLTRPLERLADEALMIEHNRLLWKLSRTLKGG